MKVSYAEGFRLKNNRVITKIHIPKSTTYIFDKINTTSEKLENYILIIISKNNTEQIEMQIVRQLMSLKIFAFTETSFMFNLK